MFRTKRSHEGYLLIDHSASPGVSPELVRASGKPAPVVGEGKKFEAPVLTCSHCQAQMVLNPKRRRARAYCPSCDHYVCDTCEAVRVKAGGTCASFARIVDLAGNLAARNSLGKNSLAVLHTIRELRRSLLA